MVKLVVFIDESLKNQILQASVEKTIKTGERVTMTKFITDLLNVHFKNEEKPKKKKSNEDNLLRVESKHTSKKTDYEI